MENLRCSYCGSTEDVEEVQLRQFETLATGNAMCRACSDRLKSKAKDTEKVYEWSNRDTST